ncbi:hypothetical protein D3C73_1356970 [compost metagenome]
MVQVSVLPIAGLFRCGNNDGGQASTSARMCDSITASSFTSPRKRTQPPISRDLLPLKGKPPTLQRIARWRMNSGVTPLT